jgi:hypothetical protein
MGKLLVIGASILAFHGGHHQKRYWWPALDNCVAATAANREGALRATAYIVCTESPAGWRLIPPPANTWQP